MASTLAPLQIIDLPETVINSILSFLFENTAKSFSASSSMFIEMETRSKTQQTNPAIQQQQQGIATRFMEVCNGWLRHLRIHTVFSSICLSSATDDGWVQTITERYGMVVSRLDLSSCRHVSELALLFIGENCPRLQELLLNRCRGFPTSALTVLFESASCCGLRSLDLSGINCKHFSRDLAPYHREIATRSV